MTIFLALILAGVSLFGLVGFLYCLTMPSRLVYEEQDRNYALLSSGLIIAASGGAAYWLLT